MGEIERSENWQWLERDYQPVATGIRDLRGVCVWKTGRIANAGSRGELSPLEGCDRPTGNISAPTV